MSTIKDIINMERPASEIIADLMHKSVQVPSWGGAGGHKGLVAEYDPKQHPVMNKALYPDVMEEDGTIDHVTRVTLNFQKLAVKRMTELCCSIPVRRVYSPEDGQQKEVASYLEKIYVRNRIDSVNVERLRMLFAGCEVVTLWYAVEQPNTYYGFRSPIKIRCCNYTPMNGDNLYPLFDGTGDMIALSIGYRRKVGKETVEYFDTYTAERHYKWEKTGTDSWVLTEEDDIHQIGKIPAVYMWRPEPIWEDTSNLVYEMEWSVSRNGNYLRKNSKPLFCVFADEEINYGQEGDEKAEFKAILQYPKGSTAGYVTWTQAVDNLKFQIAELRQSFFTQLQLPDWSYESMKSTPMSGESRKQLFIDAQLKVKDESGRLLEFFDRETNVVKAFLKLALGEAYWDAIDALPVESEVTPFTISEEKDTINNLLAANGNKPLMSQRESIEQLGWSLDVDKTLQEITEENALDAFELTR
ncbi:MAG: phage portal protein [Prevotella sp.]|nr:phage portal protein [Prevotella sp.]